MKNMKIALFLFLGLQICSLYGNPVVNNLTEALKELQNLHQHVHNPANRKNLEDIRITLYNVKNKIEYGDQGKYLVSAKDVKDVEEIQASLEASKKQLRAQLHGRIDQVIRLLKRTTAMMKESKSEVKEEKYGQETEGLRRATEAQAVYNRIQSFGTTDAALTFFCRAGADEDNKLVIALIKHGHCTKERALSNAILRGNIGLVQELLTLQPDIMATDGNGSSLLSNAVSSNIPSLVELLLNLKDKNGNKLINKTTPVGSTILDEWVGILSYKASGEIPNYEKIGIMLLEHGGKFCKTTPAQALFRSLLYGLIQMPRKLISRGEFDLSPTVTDSIGNTALHNAVLGKEPRAVELILRWASDDDEKIINLMNQANQTALDLAVEGILRNRGLLSARHRHDIKQAQEKISKYTAIGKILIKNGGKVHQKTEAVLIQAFGKEELEELGYEFKAPEESKEVKEPKKAEEPGAASDFDELYRELYPNLQKPDEAEEPDEAKA